MPTNFPTSIDSGSNWNTLVNNVDTISAGHINDPRDAVIAIETLLGASSTRRTTFSPTITFTGGMTSATYSAANSGAYARFGSLVFLSAFVDVTAISGASGEFLVNLPINGTTPDATFAVSFATGWTSLFPIVGRQNSASNVVFRSYINNAGFTTMTTTHTGTPSVGTPLRLGFSGWYFHA